MYHDLNPIVFSIGNFSVAWYGIMYLLSFVAFLYLGKWRARNQPWMGIREEQVDSLLTYIILGVILGGRLGYTLFYSFDNFLADPLSIIRLWQGGMSFHGGFIGVSLAVIIFARRHRLPIFAVGDLLASLSALGLFFGRIGNFINGELWGRAADVPWAMVFSKDPLQIARHPSQLYQAFGEGLLVFVIIWWLALKPRPMMVLSGAFMLLYGCARIGAEFFREPDAQIGFLAGQLTMGMLLSLPMVAAGLLLLVVGYRQNRFATPEGERLAKQGA